MFSKFWEKLTENLTQEWQARIMAPAFAFWTGGLFLYALRQGWQPLIDRVAAWSPAEGIVAIIAALGILTISTTFVTQFSIPLLRFLQGYWHAPLASLAVSRVNGINRKVKEKEERWNWLAQRKASNELGAAQLHEYALLDANLANFPVDENWRLPTRLGNLMRAAEEYPHLHYGLEINIAWPRLWLLLPASTQQEIGRARHNLDRAVQTFMWAALFASWAFINPWALMIAVLLALMFYQPILQTGGAYGELLKAAFDLHRFKLYEAMHWPRPESPHNEVRSGQSLINYLYRAEASKKIKYDFPTPEDNTPPRP